MRASVRASAAWRSGLALLVMVGLSGRTFAEDNRSWSFEVSALLKIDDRHSIVHLRPVPPGKSYPRSCDELILHAEFDPRTMTREQRRILDRRSHDDAIRLLREAELTNKLVRVGSVDSGFGAIPDRPRCEVASRGLRVLMEDDGMRAIYSFY